MDARAAAAPGAGLTIGQAARAAGVTRKAIRVYEDKGLVAPAARTASGYRLFDPAEVDTLAFIRRARALGLHLDDVAEVLAVRRDGRSPCPSVRSRLDQRIGDIDTAIAELQQLRRTLVATRERPTDQKPGTDAPASICPIIEHPDPSTPSRGSRSAGPLR